MRNNTFNRAASTLVGALCLRTAGGRLVAFQTGILALAFQTAMLAQPAVVADTVLINGKIVTVDPQFSIAQAVAIRERKFLAVGSNTQIEAFTGPNTVRVDLSGRTVLPALMDTHAHVASVGVQDITVSLEPT